MKITSLILKNGRVQVFVDDEYVFSCTQNFVVSNELHRDQELSREEFEILRGDAQYSIVEFKLFEYAARKANSPRELRDKVNRYCKKRFGFRPEETFFIKAFKKLDRIHLYSSKDAARNLTRKYIDFSKSRKFIFSKLVSKGFDKQEVLGVLDEEIKEDVVEDNLRRLLERKFNSLNKDKFKNDFELKQKLFQFGASKGFDFKVIKTIVDELV